MSSQQLWESRDTHIQASAFDIGRISYLTKYTSYPEKNKKLWESRDTHIHDENELRGVLRARSVCSDHVRMREPVFQRDRYRLLCTWI